MWDFKNLLKIVDERQNHAMLCMPGNSKSVKNNTNIPTSTWVFSNIQSALFYRLFDFIRVIYHE